MKRVNVSCQSSGYCYRRPRACLSAVPLRLFDEGRGRGEKSCPRALAQDWMCWGERMAAEIEEGTKQIKLIFSEAAAGCSCSYVVWPTVRWWCCCYRSLQGHSPNSYYHLTPRLLQIVDTSSDGNRSSSNCVRALDLYFDWEVLGITPNFKDWSSVCQRDRCSVFNRWCFCVNLQGRQLSMVNVYDLLRNWW